jgi:hypothetical protein
MVTIRGSILKSNSSRTFNRSPVSTRGMAAEITLWLLTLITKAME